MPHEEWGVESLLEKYSGLTLRPQRDNTLIIEGDLEFQAQYPGRERIADSYKIRIQIPKAFSSEVPAVREISGRIPKHFHTNPDDTLCLALPIELHLKLKGDTSLTSFVENCVIPFLYAFSHKEKYGNLPFGEMAHGRPGKIQGYQRLLRADTEEACLKMLFLLGQKKRIANKRICPCGSGRRVGQCHHRELNSLRKVRSRSWFRKEYDDLNP